MANPGPNIVAESLQRGEAVVRVANTASAATGAIKASAITPLTFTVTGVAVGDFVQANPTAALPTNVSFGAVYVSAANTVTIDFIKTSATDTQDAAGYYLFRVTRPYPTAANTTDFGATKPLNAGAIPLST